MIMSDSPYVGVSVIAAKMVPIGARTPIDSLNRFEKMVHKANIAKKTTKASWIPSC